RETRARAELLRAAFAALTPREKAVFDRVVAGQLNKQIAEALGIAERTVKLQHAQLMTKLGAGSAAELGRLAERLQHLPD
ncbi:MAG: LuxR C-terminal-related transcriptional regulator, partial [Thiohalocapsa sp.]